MTSMDRRIQEGNHRSNTHSSSNNNHNNDDDNSNRTRQRNPNSTLFTSSIIALVYLSSQSRAEGISEEEWDQDDGDYGQDDDEQQEEEMMMLSSQQSRSNENPSSPPPFPYLAYAVSHPKQDGSLETLRRHGLPIPKWVTSKKSPLSSYSDSSSSSSTTPQPQTQHILVPRRLIISNSDTVLIPGTETPLSPILLIVVPLAISLLFLIYALICLYTSRGPLFSSRTSRQVMDERARAKTELRLRGAGGYRPPGGIHSPDASSLGHHTTNQRSAGPSRMNSASYIDAKNLGLGLTGGNDGETSSAGSSSSGLAGGSGSRGQLNSKNPSRSYSKHAQQPSSASLLALPTLNANSRNGVQQLQNGGLVAGPRPNAGTGRYAGRAPSSYAGGAPITATNSNASTKSRHRMSTSVGRGTDLGRNRSLKREISRNSTSADQEGVRRSGSGNGNGNRYDPLNSSGRNRNQIPSLPNPYDHSPPPLPLPQHHRQNSAGMRGFNGTGPYQLQQQQHRRRPSNPPNPTFLQQTQKLYGSKGPTIPAQTQGVNRNSILSIGDNPLDIGEDSLDSHLHSRSITAATGCTVRSNGTMRSAISSASSDTYDHSMTGHPLLPMNGIGGYADGGGHGNGYGDERNPAVPGAFF